ncbi:MAG: ABC transporter substrate-binding protein [Ignavibacteria bacterium CG_4_9_14_3_um_filter_36_18]|nr:MAG: ABC transporter substrate-binding protein [Ignavibacteria bacterium CG_4_9_14_3_um_filter_36_18]
MKHFKHIAAVILFLCIFLSPSCSKENEGDKIIKFWAMGTEAEYVAKLVPEFEKQNPGIKIKVQQIPWTAAQEKLITAFASDNTPDACQLGNTWVPQFAYLNGIVSLDKFISSSPIIKKENYFNGIWDTNVIDSLVYGIPWYVDTRILFYRSDIFKRAGYDNPPKTWAELYDLSKKIKSLFQNKDKYAIYLPTNEWASFVIFGLQAGANILKDNSSRGNFSSEEFKTAFEFLIRFHKEKLAPLGISQVTNVYQAFADEYFSMYISGPWNINEFKKWMINDLADKWKTSPLPSKGNNYPGVSLAGGASLVIFKNSKHKNETWKFIEYLSKSSTQIKFFNLVNNLPAVKEAWGDSSISKDVYMKAFYQQFENVAATPKIPEWEQIAFSKIQQYAELAARGVISSDEALKNLDKDVDIILEKRRWLIGKEK